MLRLRGTGGLAVVAAALCLPVMAQKPLSDLGGGPAASKPQKTPAVEYLFPEQVTIAAGKPTEVEMHFRVAPGLHINSHDPKGEEMIPTTFKLPEGSPVHLVRATFPAGKDFALPLAPAERLSVYTGEFTVKVVLEAPAGEQLVEASLRYQACDNSACMPPHSIPVVFDVLAR